MRRREFLALLGGAVTSWPLDVGASFGPRSAIERAAQFFLELAKRPSLLGCQLSLLGLADALALSAIHVSRVIRQLDERELLSFRKGIVTIHNAYGLKKLAGNRTAI